MNMPFAPLAGSRGLFVGAADEHSMAWGCARSASALGARLVLGCLNDASAAAVAPLAARLGAPLLACDAQRPGALEAMVDAAAAQLGGFDFVVHSVAWTPSTDLRGRLTESSAEALLQAMRLACHSFARLARRCGPHMPGGGALVTMSHFGAEGEVPNDGLTGTARAAFESIVRYLALELGPWGIRVHAVSAGTAPGGAGDGGLAASMPGVPAAGPPMHRFRPDNIGDRVAFLVGPGGAGVTGRTLYVDVGARSLH